MSLAFIMSKYRILGKKGEGTFSEVLKCQNVKDGSYWACKKMKQHYESVEQVNNLREIQALRRLSPHANILELKEVIFDKKSGTLVLICELMDMNIYELIRGRRQHLPDRMIKNYMYQLVKSIDYAHRNGIFHRDVKPENILIKDDLLKLADFGSCRSVYSKQPYTEYISTRWYRAPECLLTDGYYTYKMDIWSVGCVFFEVMSLHPLFPGANEVDQIAKIHDIMGTPDMSVLNKLRNKSRGMNFNFPQKKGSGIEKLLPHASSECKDLICQMCQYDPDERLTAKQALRHPYFKELRDADKQAARQQKLQREGDLKQELQVKNSIESNTEEKTPRGESPKENNLQNKKSPRPGSGPTIVPRYTASILHNKDPVYTYHRKEKRRKRHRARMSDTGPSPTPAMGLLPKVTNPPKPNTFQPTFQTTTFGAASLPKLGGTNVASSTTTYLPSLSQAFIKPAKPTKATKQATQNMYGHYQLPSIKNERRDF